MDSALAYLKVRRKQREPKKPSWGEIYIQFLSMTNQISAGLVIYRLLIITGVVNEIPGTFTQYLGNALNVSYYIVGCVLVVLFMISLLSLQVMNEWDLEREKAGPVVKFFTSPILCILLFIVGSPVDFIYWGSK